MKKNINKAYLVTEVAKRIGLSELMVGYTIDATFDMIRESIDKRQNIVIQGVGTFAFVQAKARVARNPKTNDLFYLGNDTVLKFKPHYEVKQSLVRKRISLTKYKKQKRENDK